ncbi:ABC transporter permease subunit [Aquibium sp. LZ166]|uniref:ABC transporter permease subunit n=1 Tax=Aquibium pacificus TaxID=3153579 RepID=A0ABV3SEX0_9HYPH
MSKHTLTGLVLVALFVALLELLVATEVISRFLVARPSDIFAELLIMLREESLPAAFGITFASTFVATAIAAGIGFPVGYALHRSELLGQAYGTFVAGLFSAPLILLYPLFLVLFGRTVVTTVAIAALTASIPVIISTKQAFDGVKSVFLKVGTSFSMSRPQVFLKIMLPSALPTLFTGLRLGLIYAMICVVAVEYLVNLGGLGFLVGEMYDRFNIAGMYAAILAVVVVSVLFFDLTERAERWLRYL